MANHDKTLCRIQSNSFLRWPCYLLFIVLSLNLMNSNPATPLDLVDISELNSEIAEKLLSAASNQGFLMLEGHGFTQIEVDELFQLSKSFFGLSLEEKLKYPFDNSSNGYVPFGGQNLEQGTFDDKIKSVGDPKEAYDFGLLNFETGEFGKSNPPFFLIPRNRELLSSVILKLKNVLHQVMRLLAIALNIIQQENGQPDINWFVDKLSGKGINRTTLRLLHYPTPKTNNDPQESKVNIAGAHSDFGCVTILFQKENEEGLQILSPKSQKWEWAPFVPASETYASQGYAPPLIVNIADMLSYWTNGLLTSTVHRVRFPPQLLAKRKDRYSIVYFANPDEDVLLEPVPSEMVQKIKGRGASKHLEKHGASITAGQHLQNRIRSSYDVSV